MASNKLSAQDKKDLDKFTKFLALKSAQIIVQSRLGEKINTKCNPETLGTDWVSIFVSYFTPIKKYIYFLIQTLKSLFLIIDYGIYLDSMFINKDSIT